MPSTGLSRVTAAQSGWISKQWVADGDHVQLGQTLYTLRLDGTTSSGSSGEATVSLLREKIGILRADLLRQAEINDEKKRSLDKARKSTEAEARQIDTQIALAMEHAELLNALADKQKANLKRGLIRDADYEPRLQNLLSQQAQIEQLKRDRAEIQTRLDDVTAQLDSFDLNAASQASKMKQAIIEAEQNLSENEARFEIVIKAPRTGTVTAVVGHEGQTVVGNMPLLTILPDADPLAAQLFVPSSAIGFIREGQRVLVRYDSFPYQKFGQYPGTVIAVSRTTLSVDGISAAGLDVPDKSSGTQMYRVTVRPDDAAVRAYGKTMPLQVGMNLEASVLTDTRPLYQWILDPLYSLGTALPSAAAKQ